jgi:predicted nucleic acid-binding protein
MKLYVDASVLLRVVLGEPGALSEFRQAARWISSELVRVECLRTIDRARLQFDLPDEALAGRRSEVLDYLDAFELVSLNRGVLTRAAEPFPTILGTLDAIHLASAVLVRDQVPDLVVATHDRELAVAARSVGFRVLGATALA